MIFRYPDGYDLPSKRTNKYWGAELLGNERILMLPPSIHPEGTQYRWVEGYSPDKIQLTDIPEALLHAFVGEGRDEVQPSEQNVTEKVSKADVEGTSFSEGTLSFRPPSPTQKQILKAILVPYWVKGYRHELALGLGGLLAKEGIAMDDALDLLRQIAVEAKDEEWKDRERALNDSFERLWRGEPVIGYKRLEEVVGDEVAGCIAYVIRKGHQAEWEGNRGRKESAKGDAEQVTLLTLKEWCERQENIGAAQWCIEGLLRESWLLILNAHPKTGKSIVAVNMAHALASGKPFLTQPV